MAWSIYLGEVAGTEHICTDTLLWYFFSKQFTAERSPEPKVISLSLVIVSIFFFTRSCFSLLFYHLEHSRVISSTGYSWILWRAIFFGLFCNFTLQAYSDASSPALWFALQAPHDIFALKHSQLIYFKWICIATFLNQSLEILLYCTFKSIFTSKFCDPEINSLI